MAMEADDDWTTIVKSVPIRTHIRIEKMEPSSNLDKKERISGWDEISGIEA